MTAVQLPLKLEEDWNNLEINFQTLCQDIFGTDYEVLQRIIIYPNCRLRRVYLQDRHYEHDETPVELCQAFFDMYMLKWGIHLVDKSSQTEETYTGNINPNFYTLQKLFKFHLIHFSGPLQPSDVKCISNESNVSIPIISKPSIALYNISKQTGNKFVSCTHMLERDKIVVKFNSKSVNQLDSKIKINKGKNTNADENGFKNKLKNASEKRLTKESEKDTNVTESPSIYLNESNVQSQKALMTFPHLKKSKYLQMLGYHFRKNIDKEGSIFAKWPYKYEELNREIKNVPTINETGNILTYPIEKSILKVKDNGFQDHNVNTIKNIISEVQRVREQLNNKNYNFQSAVKFGNPSETKIPDFVELEAKPSERKSKSKLLTSDEIVSDFLKSRFIANKTMFERLKKKGLTMTEVELSIYNSKNRRNCYGQGKIVESCKRSADKATDFGITKEIDNSFKKEKLNYAKASQENELDVILSPHPDSTEKASSIQLFNVQESITGNKNYQKRKNVSKIHSASVNYLWNKTEENNNVVKGPGKSNSNQKVLKI